MGVLEDLYLQDYAEYKRACGSSAPAVSTHDLAVTPADDEVIDKVVNEVAMASEHWVKKLSNRLELKDTATSLKLISTVSSLFSEVLMVLDPTGRYQRGDTDKYTALKFSRTEAIAPHIEELLDAWDRARKAGADEIAGDIRSRISDMLDKLDSDNRDRALPSWLPAKPEYMEGEDL